MHRTTGSIMLKLQVHIHIYTIISDSHILKSEFLVHVYRVVELELQVLI